MERGTHQKAPYILMEWYVLLYVWNLLMTSRRMVILFFFKSGHVPLSILILFVFQKHLVKQKNIISFADMKLFFLSTYAQSIFIYVIISMKLLNGIFLIFVVRVKFSVIEFWIRSLLLWFIVINLFESLLPIRYIVQCSFKISENHYFS